MRQKEIIVFGTITSDGRLAMYMAQLSEFLRNNKNNRVIATFRAYKPGTSQALSGYYYNYIIPTIKRALHDIGERRTDKEVDLWIREMSPIMHRQIINEETGEYADEIRGISDLDNAEFIELIETIKQFAATELAVFIDDPKTI